MPEINDRMTDWEREREAKLRADRAASGESRLKREPKDDDVDGHLRTGGAGGGLIS